MLGHSYDTLQTKFLRVSPQVKKSWSKEIRFVETKYGKIRIRDTRGSKPPLIVTPDGPCVLEHYEELIEILRAEFRVIGFEFPGFGFSYPSQAFDFTMRSGAEVVIALMDSLRLKRATLAFTCANGYYALMAAQNHPERIEQIFLSQTPSIAAMRAWKKKNLPIILDVPVVGQILISALAKKNVSHWYKKALPKSSPRVREFEAKALTALENQACFCLASIVQGLNPAKSEDLLDIATPTTLFYGDQDGSHRGTNFSSLKDHVPDCKIIEFKKCGHFPDLEYPEKFAKHLIGQAH